MVAPRQSGDRPNGAELRKTQGCKHPVAAVHHKVAAAFSPRMLKPSFRITPPPRKPMPETMWAAARPD
jgi:hypothetical protein